jgi:hypothetical protein
LSPPEVRLQIAALTLAEELNLTRAVGRLKIIKLAARQKIAPKLFGGPAFFSAARRLLYNDQRQENRVDNFSYYRSRSRFKCHEHLVTQKIQWE